MSAAAQGREVPEEIRKINELMRQNAEMLAVLGSGDVDKVRGLIVSGVIGCDCLEEELVAGRVSNVRTLIAAGLDPVPSLVSAFKKNFVQHVKILLEAGVDLQALKYMFSSGGKSIVCHAIENKCSREMLQLLVDYKADPYANFDGFNRIYMSPLLLAVKTGNFVAVQFLLDQLRYPAEKSAVVNELACISDTGYGMNHTVPLVAALEGLYKGKRVYEDIAMLLLGNNANINKSGRYGLTPLMIAANYGCDVIVDSLLEAKADIHAKTTHGVTAAVFAVNGGLSMLKTLLESKAKLPTANTNDENNEDVLSMAVRGGKTRVVKYMLDNGIIKINKPSDYSRCTPVQYAAKYGNAKMLLFLMRSKANPGIRSISPSPLLMSIKARARASDGMRIGVGDILKISFVMLMFNWRASSAHHELGSRKQIKALQNELDEAAEARDSAGLDAKLKEATEKLGSDVSGLKLYFALKYSQQAWIDPLELNEEAISLSALYARGKKEVAIQNQLSGYMSILKERGTEMQVVSRPGGSVSPSGGGGGGGGGSKERPGFRG